MKSYAIFEAKNRLSELVASVQNGEEITLTATAPLWHVWSPWTAAILPLRAKLKQYRFRCKL